MDETVEPEELSTPASATTEAEELGVLGAQAASADRAARARMANAEARAKGEEPPVIMPQPTKTEFRAHALQLAQEAFTRGIIAADEVTATATTYYEFIMEVPSD